MGQNVSQMLPTKVSTAPHPALSLLDKMLAEQADVKKIDEEENTVLHNAVKVVLGTWMGEEPLIEEPDAPAPTPSEMATKLGELLCRHPAASLDTAQRLHNDDGLMPFHLAVEEGSVETCEVLLKAGAPVTRARCGPPRPCRRTATCAATGRGATRTAVSSRSTRPTRLRCTSRSVATSTTRSAWL